ncbi:hypothetical protein D6C84_03868 [Aureobasidium pullulans]|uniref:Uncharacterized protein n=1 Tax=Aureobasidium pullulans TaxID=5580 RepID=A0A4S9XY95_AURPU|nr:hypothetical protein D6C84_03868 [Aureobasidium pullulans]
MSAPTHPQWAAMPPIIGFQVMAKDGKKVPPCECDSCGQQFIRADKQNYDLFRYENIVPPAEAQSTITAFVTQITIDRAYLAGLCDKFGNTILSRWRKKSHDKRETILLEADPTIEKQAWYRLRNDGGPWRPERQLHRQVRLLPYMCTTTMKSNPSVLLGLIHNHVRHSLQEWVPFDNDLIRQGWENGTLGVDYCGNHCIVMHGVNYGQLVPWNKEAAERWDIIGYPRARLIIEAQALMFSRLRSIVDLILEGVNDDSAHGSDKWQAMVVAGFKQSNSTELWSDYINQPFSKPPRFDVDYYCSVAKARLQAAQDHLWLLQTDPSYTRRFIRVMAAGELYRTDWKYDIVAQDIHQAVVDCMRWQQLSEEWSGIKDQYNRYRDSIHPGQPLPKSLELSLALLESALLMILEKWSNYLRKYIPQRPGFQHLWTTKPAPKGTTSEGKRVFGEIERKTSIKQGLNEDPLDWIVMKLLSHANTENRFDQSELLARLEAHVAETNSTERARLDETIYAKMSDSAALHEMLSAVRLHRPAFNRRSPLEVLDMAKQNSTLFTRSLVSGDGPAKVYAFMSGSLKLFDQIGPAVGRKSEAWLKHRTAERKALNSFWTQAHETMRVELNTTKLRQEEINATLAIISVSSTTGYAELVEAERLETLEAIRDAVVAKEVKKSISKEVFSKGDPDVSKLAIAERAPKPKTRPSAPIDAPDDAPALSKPGEENPISRQQIPAPPRAFGLVKKMFPVTAQETTANLDWDIFVHSMADLSFAARNVGGSAVAFDHAASGRKIIFHRPHPVSKIDSVMLQSMGKRLSKHFGWNRDVFVEA